MVRSMTGYGRAEGVADGRNIVVEIKSVNHRYFEFSSRVTRGYGFLEEKLKSYLQERISRGKTDAYVSVEIPEDSAVVVQLNHPLAAGYLGAMRELSEKYGLANDVTVSVLSRYSDIFTVRKPPEDEAAVWNAVRQIADEAIARFIAMRETEGARLREDVCARAETIRSIVEKIEARSPQTVAEYRQRLKNKIEELLNGATVDEQRLLTETAIFADKIAVEEQTVRLRSHLKQLDEMMESGGAIGRKLDFLVQEMNREANTIGSKAVDSQIAYMVVDIKAEIEKIREQIQNIE